MTTTTTTTTTAMTTKTTARLRRSRWLTLKYDKRTCVYSSVASSKFCLCTGVVREPCSWRVDAQRVSLTRRHEPCWCTRDDAFPLLLTPTCTLTTSNDNFANPPKYCYNIFYYS
ncbi:hypothetical protein M0804_001514 [Polistes exclamans]|nr:hypothetical protein M0804_001514 [Polistes exclamans]